VFELRRSRLARLQDRRTDVTDQPSDTGHAPKFKRKKS
jgi:hypothetical protein